MTWLKKPVPGMKNAMSFLEENPAAAQEIELALREKLLAKPKKKGDVEEILPEEGAEPEVAEAK